MTWEQKIQACQALTGANGIGFTLHMRAPGDWYVSQPGINRRVKSMLEGGCISAATPERVVEQYWAWIASQSLEHCIEVTYCGETRNVRWNGFMWQDVEPPK